MAVLLGLLQLYLSSAFDTISVLKIRPVNGIFDDKEMFLVLLANMVASGHMCF